MLVYRIVRNKFSNDLTGTGARLFGGRWNSVGLSVLYTSSYRSLALLEVLVHTTHELVPNDLRLVTIEIPEEVHIAQINYEEIENEVLTYKIHAQMHTIGDDWIRASSALAIRVPSIVLPEEFNVLINPMHQDFQKIKIKENKPFSLDERLLV